MKRELSVKEVVTSLFSKGIRTREDSEQIFNKDKFYISEESFFILADIINKYRHFNFVVLNLLDILFYYLDSSISREFYSKKLEDKLIEILPNINTAGNVMENYFFEKIKETNNEESIFSAFLSSELLTDRLDELVNSDSDYIKEIYTKKFQNEVGKVRFTNSDYLMECFNIVQKFRINLETENVPNDIRLFIMLEE